MEAQARKIIERIKNGDITEEKELHAAKKAMAGQLEQDKVPANGAILEFVEDGEMDAVRDVLGRKPTRTISGVATIAVMWMWDSGNQRFPSSEEDRSRSSDSGDMGSSSIERTDDGSVSGFSCPYSCSYCPQGTHEGTKAPKSYTGKEPSARRAIDNAYDPYDQVSARINQLETIGHPTDKSEIIVMGGTFPATPTAFQEHFIKRCFDALNQEDADGLKEAHRINETAERRNVGLTIETRPDFTKKKHVNDFLRFGCTRVEMGVQTLDDAVHERTDRGHGTDATVKATHRLKDCGFKVCYHMMLGLPGESREADIDKFRELFADTRFQPDELKIYPTAVIEGTRLHEEMEQGDYKPLSEDELYERLLKIKPHIPEYCRIKRIMRDIPSTEIDEGASRTNARQILHRKMAETGVECRCIRCREAGHIEQKEGRTPDRAELVARSYTASHGTEHFLSIEDPDEDILMGYCRLRFPDESMRDEIGEDTAIVRQVQVVGPAVPLGEEGDVQHSGYGTRLMREAEERAREAGFKNLAVISAVGTRKYYEKLGYTRDGPYMCKEL